MIYKDPKTCLDGFCFIVLVICSFCLFGCGLFQDSRNLISLVILKWCFELCFCFFFFFSLILAAFCLFLWLGLSHLQKKKKPAILYALHSLILQPSIYSIYILTFYTSNCWVISLPFTWLYYTQWEPGGSQRYYMPSKKTKKSQILICHGSHFTSHAMICAFLIFWFKTA